MSNVWAISTNKGGVLKTSVTTNIAGVMAKKKKKVLIIDTDNQGNVLLSFGGNPDKLDSTLYDVLVEGTDPKEAIVNVYKNIDVLPANDDMAFFEFDVLSNQESYPRPFSLLKKSLDIFKDRYDVILIDTPPNLGLTQGNVLSFADHVLIPFQPESYSMRSLIKILKAINDFKIEHNPSLSVLGIIATLVDQRTTLHSDVLQECRKYASEHNLTLFETVIPRSVRFASSVAYERLPASLTSHSSPLVASYYNLVEEINKSLKGGLNNGKRQK